MSERKTQALQHLANILGRCKQEGIEVETTNYQDSVVILVKKAKVVTEKGFMKIKESENVR